MMVVLEIIRSTHPECKSVQDLYAECFHAVSITEFCFGRFTQFEMASIKNALFQYLSAKFSLLWFCPQSITTHNTYIQKWISPVLVDIDSLLFTSP